MITRQIRKGDLVRLKYEYRIVGPMNLWDDWKLLTDDQVENFRYFFENDLGIVLVTKKQTYNIIRSVRILSTRGEVGWISENLIEILSNKP